MSDEEQVGALVDAVCAVLLSASWHPEDDIGSSQMTVDSQAVMAMDLACNALIQARAEAKHGVIRD